MSFLSKLLGKRMHPSGAGERVVLTTVGESTRQADLVMGYNGDTSVTPLDRLPPLELDIVRVADPGSPLQPAVFLSMKSIALAALADVYHAMWKAHGGNYDVLAHTEGGWRTLLDLGREENADTIAVNELAFTIDLVEAVKHRDELAATLELLHAGAHDLANRLGAEIKGAVDAPAAERHYASLSEVTQKNVSEVSLAVIAESESGFLGADIHRVARSLGMAKGDFGSYTLYNNTPVGSDQLLTVRPIDEPYRFDLGNPRARYRGVGLWFSACTVPKPTFMLEQLLHAAMTFAEHLSGRVERIDGEPFDEETFREEVARSLEALSKAGLLVGTEPPDAAGRERPRPAPAAAPRNGAGAASTPSVDPRAPRALQAVPVNISSRIVASTETPLPDQDTAEMDVDVGVLEPSDLSLYDEEARAVQLRTLIVGNRASEYIRTLGDALGATPIGADRLGDDEPDILYVAMQLGDIRGWATTIHFYAVPTDRMFEPMRRPWITRIQSWAGEFEGIVVAHNQALPSGPFNAPERIESKALPTGWETVPAVTYAPEAVAERWLAVTGWEPIYAGAADVEHVVPGVKLLAKVMLSRLKAS